MQFSVKSAVKSSIKSSVRISVKISKFIFVAILFNFFYATSSWGTIAIEPYAGYVLKGEWEMGSSDAKIKNFTFGAKLGYKITDITIGLDYMSGKMKDDADPKNDITPDDIGAYINYDFPTGMIRAYFAYYFQAQLEFKDDSNTNDYDGTAMKFGIGYKAMPILSVNLEYIQGSYDKVNGRSLTQDLETSLIILGASFPLEF